VSKRLAKRERARREREEFAIRLQRAMIRAGVSGAELAERLARNPRTVAGWKNAEHLPDIGDIADIGKALNCDPEWLWLGDRAYG
jgi:transcriptional regulator with XRE-family HTH domain